MVIELQPPLSSYIFILPLGLEPRTFRLLAECSNQLSYESYGMNVLRLQNISQVKHMVLLVILCTMCIILLFIVSVAEWSKASDSSSDGENRVGSNPTADMF